MTTPPAMYPTDTVAPWRRRLSRGIERATGAISNWLLDHWLTLINVGLGTLLGVALLVPVLAYFDIEPLARTVFTAYHAMCDQIPSHSYYILGHQIALCSRNLALYGSIWLGSMLYRPLRGRIRPLNWIVLILLLLPMALDGGTQLFGWRESNWELRTITGALFGLGICWFALPFVQQAIDEPPPPPRFAVGAWAEPASSN